LSSISAIAQARTLPKKDAAEIFQTYGPMYFFIGRPDRAIQLTAQAARDLPNSEDAAIMHLDVCMMHENFATAEAAGQEYLRMHPEWNNVRLHTAQAMESEKHYAAALALMEQRLKKAPKDVPAILAAASFRLRLPGYQKSLPSLANTAQLLDALKLEDRVQQREAAMLRAITLGLMGKTAEATTVLEGIETDDDSIVEERVSAAKAALGESPR
jgi:tetratricopeptide (TPR) repeat protein